MKVDPNLMLDCQYVLQREEAVHRYIGQEGYQRRAMLRRASDEQANELIIVYEASEIDVRQELVLLRQQLADAIDAVQDPFAYYDMDDYLVHYNSAYARLHHSDTAKLTVGMKFEAVLRQDVEAGLIGVPAAQRDNWLRYRLAQRQRQMCEEEVRLCDGRWFRVTQRMTRGGEYVHMLVDITDLKYSQANLEQVIYGSRAATWSINLDTGKSSVNDHWASLLGLDPMVANALGFEGWRGLVHPEDVATAEAGFLKCVRCSETNFEAEYRLRHALGGWVWVLGRGGISDRHSDGRPYRISGVLLDISRQKRLEAELAIKATAVAATEEGVTIFDDAWNIIYTNPAHAAMFGYDDPRLLVGKSWQSLYTTEEWKKLATDAFPSIKDHGFWSGQAIALCKDGETFEQDLSLTGMPDGKIVCVSRDVTARNTLSREIILTRDRMEQAQRQEIVNSLVVGLTHDLLNLITTISYISDPIFEDAEVQPADMVKNIHITARQAIALLEPIRKLGMETNFPQQVNIAQLLQETACVLQLGASPKLRVMLNIPEEPIVTMVDPIKLMQVFLNIGLNGRDALGEGMHELELSLSRDGTIPQKASLEVGNIPQTPYALCQIRDTGTGIAPDVRTRIWEPRFTTKGNMGTGLGLPVVSEIVKAAGGAIALHTSRREGTTFYVVWPLSNEAAE